MSGVPRTLQVAAGERQGVSSRGWVWKQGWHRRRARAWEAAETVKWDRWGAGGTQNRAGSLVGVPKGEAWCRGLSVEPRLGEARGDLG